MGSDHNGSGTVAVLEIARSPCRKKEAKLNTDFGFIGFLDDSIPSFARKEHIRFYLCSQGLVEWIMQGPNGGFERYAYPGAMTFRNVPHCPMWKADTRLLEALDFVLCLENLATPSSDLFLHVSKNPKEQDIRWIADKRFLSAPWCIEICPGL